MKKFVIFLAIIALILPIAIFFSKKDRQKIITNNTSIETPQREVWLNIFVHGTFGTLTGLLSLNSVLKDDVRGTTYRGVNKGMRNDAYFFQTQPILERGLQKLTPSFNPDDTNKKILAAYPITKIHDEFFKKINPNDHSKQYYYTFGWSGLISQYRRRFEAIRLYNALEEEIELLKKQNITPRIRIYAYSHGGNLCLNLGGIASVLNTKTFKEFYKYSLDPQADDSIKKMLAIIKNLPTKEDAFLLEGQKRFDYIPTNKNFFIDELILLGTPIQSETEHFLHSSVFGTIYNIYSSQDTVQKLDWISTKNTSSKQRIELSAKEQNKKKSGPRIVQIKIMYEHPVSKNTESVLNVVKEDNNEHVSLINKLLGAQPLSKDPGHKELWALAWASAAYSNNSAQSFLSPIPTVTLMPVVLTMLAKHQELTDVDVNITPVNNEFGFFITSHTNNTVIESLYIERSFLEDIKKQLTLWESKETSAEQDFKMIYQHLSKSKQHFEKPLQKAA